MEEVLDHNQEAEQIFRQYGRLLELVAAAQLPGRPEDAEECVQDAVWAFVEGRAPWDPAQGSKQTWLCVLVRSRAKDRRRALAARMEEPLEEHSGLAAADHAERAAVRNGGCSPCGLSTGSLLRSWVAYWGCRPTGWTPG